jgi:hypothetical protein
LSRGARCLGFDLCHVRGQVWKEFSGRIILVSELNNYVGGIDSVNPNLL